MIGENKKNIIISADDFGISQKASRNILDLIKKGQIDRAEVMMSKNITPKYVSELLASGVKLDIHFHLAKDKLDYWQNHERIIEKGALKRTLLFLWNLFFGCNQPKKVREEWEKQLNMFKNMFGKNPDGASSHEHIHFFPPYFKIIADLSSKYKISYIRFGKKSFSGNNKVSIILNWLRKISRRTFKKCRLNSSYLMVSFDWINDLDALLDNLPDNKTTEIVFHPELDSEYKVLNNG